MTDHFLAATLFIDGLLAGVFVCSAMVEHAMRTLDAPHWIAYVQAKEKVFGPVMPIFFGIGLVTTIVDAAVSWPHMGLAIAAVALGGAGAITGAVNLPLNALFKTWSATEHPADWAIARTRWRRWTLARTALAVVAFAAVL